MSDEQEPSDCSTPDGIVVGLVDGMIAQARIVASYVRAGRAGHDVREALADLRSDPDVAAVLRPDRRVRQRTVGPLSRGNPDAHLRATADSTEPT